MARLLLVLALAAVIFWVYSVVDAAVQPSLRHRGVRKPVWVAIVIVFPVLGGVLWFLVGRAPARTMAVRAPDDDPEFLRGLGSSGAGRSHTRTLDDPRARAEQEERIRRLEQELRGLDRDDDDPSSGPRRDR